MAIPEGRMSTTPVLGEYLPPEGVVPHPTTTYEAGPIDTEDTSEGLLYQTWRLTWDAGTGNLTLRAMTTFNEYVLGVIANLSHASFTFDQAGRVSYTWTDNVSSYLYWYDTSLGMTVTTDLGVDVITPTLYLDDKRPAQTTVNDMILWYTKPDGFGQYKLYNALQRERFLMEHEMMANLDSYYIVACGMTDELRIQLRLRSIGYA